MFRRAVVATLILSGTMLLAQAQRGAQTPRQALVQILTTGDILNHLPEATRAAIEKSGSASSLMLPAMQMQAMSKGFQVFPAGSVLLSVIQPTGEKFQVNILSRSDLQDARLNVMRAIVNRDRISSAVLKQRAVIFRLMGRLEAGIFQPALAQVARGEKQ